MHPELPLHNYVMFVANITRSREGSSKSPLQLHLLFVPPDDIGTLEWARANTIQVDKATFWAMQYKKDTHSWRMVSPVANGENRGVKINIMVPHDIPYRDGPTKKFPLPPECTASKGVPAKRICPSMVPALAGLGPQQYCPGPPWCKRAHYSIDHNILKVTHPHQIL